MTTPNLSLPEVNLGQSFPNVPINQALRILDALVSGSVTNLTTTAPPASPAEGDAYIVASPATGAWAGKEKNVAFWSNGAWQFVAPTSGMLVFNVADSSFYRYIAPSWGVLSTGVAPPFSGARVYNSATQSISASSNTAVTYNTVSYDTSSYYSAGSPTRFTVPVSGYYRIAASVMWDGNNTGYRALRISKNGSTTSWLADSSVGAAAETGHSISCDVYLAANDYVEAYVYENNSTRVLTPTGESNSFSITLLGTDTGSPSLYKYKTADQTVSSSTALTDVTELTFALAASSKYVIEYEIYHQIPATPDMQAAINYTGTNNSYKAHYYRFNTAGEVAGVFKQDITLGTGIAWTVASQQDGVCKLTCTIETNTAGTFSFQFAQNTSNATATTVKRGSWGRCTKVG